MDVKGIWESFPNENICSLHLTIELWDSLHVEVHNVPLSDDEKQLIFDIEAVRGIAKISFEKFSIRITKGTAFDWQEITPRIESVVSAWSGQRLQMGEERPIDSLRYRR